MDGSTLLQLALLHAAQLTLLVLLVAAAVRICGQRSPHLAYVLWLAVLMKCFVPPVWSSRTGVFCWHSAAVSRKPAVASDIGPPDRRISERPVLSLTMKAGTRATDLVASNARPNYAITTPTEAASSGVQLGVWLTAAWLAGMVFVLLRKFRQWRRYWRDILEHEVNNEPQLQERFERLCVRFGVRSTVGLLVTSSRIGPAVIGVLRPVVVLPCILVGRSRPEHIDALLVHELMHIRRGDLWLSLLQTAAQALWWFNPLVSLASRHMNRAVEQCCDEQVIGRGIHPVDYARAMYEVLLCKHELEVVPTYPGVKAVSISRQRMERIMKLGQGCRRRTPLWCWILVIVLAAVTLPGAAIVSAERTREPARRRSTQREGSQPAAVLKGRGVNGDAGVVGQVVIAAAREAEETEGSEGAKPDVQQEQPRTYAKVYNVADLVVPATPNEPIRLQWNRKQQAWDLILDDAVVRVGPFGNLQPVGRDFNFESLIKLLQANVAPDSWLEKGGIGTVEEFPTTLSLVVSQTEEIHKAIAQQLSRLRDLQAQIVCDIHVLELPTSVKEGFHLEGAANDPIAPAHSRDELNVQPVKLSEEKTAQLLRAAHKHPLAKVVSVRRMAIYSKQHVEVSYNAGDLEYTMPVRATIASNGGIQIDIPEDAGAAEAAITELLTAGESLVLAVSGTTAGWAEADIDRSLLGSLRRFIVGSPVPETVYLVVTPSIPEKAAP